jgi:hypothetical protein
MTMNEGGLVMATTDEDFSLMLTNPEEYATRAEARLAGADQGDEIGALSLRRRARALSAAGRRLARRSGGTALNFAKRTHPMALASTAARHTARGLAAATGPIRRRIFKAFFGKLALRRARLLAWSSRRSLQPTSAEASQARRWAVAYVKRRGLVGRMLGTVLAGDHIGEPASTTLLTASVPVLLALAKRALQAAERQGAPVDPRSEDGAESADRED